MEDWHPPDLLAALKGMASGYTKGLKMQPEQVSLSGEKQIIQASVSFFRKGEKPKFDLQDRDKVRQNPRTVKLTLISGAMAVIDAPKPGGSQQVCLCHPGATLSLDEINSCQSETWRQQQRNLTCRATDKRQNEGLKSLPIYAPGAVLSFTSLRPATVSSK